MSAPPTPVRLAVHPAVTDHIEISINSWKPVLDRTALGLTQEQPPGLAEVSVLGPGYPPPAPGDRPVTIDCAHGPTIAVAGRVLHTSVTASADDLRTGNPVPATVCAAGAETAESAVADGTPRSVDLPAGSVDVTVAPTEMFSVDELRLDNTAFPAAGKSDGSVSPSAERAAPIATEGNEPGAEAAGASGATAGTAPPEAIGDPALPAGPAPTGISAPAGDRLLTLPLSTNVGWSAHTADGHPLRPVVVDGWKQGWILPAAARGPVTVEFAMDRWYRIAIFGGLLLLIPLALLALPVPRRLRHLLRRNKSGAEAETSAPDAVRDESTARDDEPAETTPLSVTEPGPAAVPHGPPPRTWNSWWLGAAGIAVAAFLIAGPIAMACAAAALIAVRFLPRAPFVLAATAGAGTVIAEMALSTGPWRSGTEYMGGSLWVQFPALVAVIAVGVAALPGQRRIRIGRKTSPR